MTEEWFHFVTALQLEGRALLWGSYRASITQYGLTFL